MQSKIDQINHDIVETLNLHCSLRVSVSEEISSQTDAQI